MTFNEAISAVPLSLDWNVLLFALAVSLVSAVLCGLAPALKASRTDINANLKDESRAASSGRSHHRLRTVLVTAEVALACSDDSLYRVLSRVTADLWRRPLRQESAVT